MKESRVDPAKLRDKESALLELLSTHHSVYVHIDARYSGVLAPTKLRALPQVAFCLGLNLPNPVRNLKIDGQGWSAVLSFGGVAHACFVPWAAVYLIVGDSGIGTHWELDTPPEARVHKLERENIPPIVEEKRRTLPPGWRVLEGGKRDRGPLDDAG